MSRLLLGAVCAAMALAATIFWETQAPAEPLLGLPSGRPSVPVMALDEPAPDTGDLTQGWMATAFARPLFRESRRPASAASVAALKAADPVRLTGVMTGPFGNRAIFMAAENAKAIVVGEGAHIGDGVIRSIEPGQVVVESMDRVQTLRPAFAEQEQPAPR